MLTEARHDCMILTLHDLVERGGPSAQKAADRVGITRNAALGILKRVRDDLAASEVAPFARGTGPAVRVGNRDGDLGPLWWRRVREDRRAHSLQQGAA